MITNLSILALVVFSLALIVSYDSKRFAKELGQNHILRLRSEYWLLVSLCFSPAAVPIYFITRLIGHFNPARVRSTTPILDESKYISEDQKIKIERRHFYPVLGIIFLNIFYSMLVFLKSDSNFFPDDSELIQWGALYNPLVTRGESWRLLYYSLIHGNLFHMAVNMVGLLQFGPTIVASLGSGVFFFIYIACTLSSGIFSLHFYPVLPVVGASGAIFGLLGALTAIYGIQIRKSKYYIFLFLQVLLYSLFAMKTETSGVAGVAHLVGFIFGIGCTYFLLKVNMQRSFRYQLIGLLFGLWIGAFITAPKEIDLISRDHNYNETLNKDYMEWAHLADDTTNKSSLLKSIEQGKILIFQLDRQRQELMGLNPETTDGVHMKENLIRDMTNDIAFIEQKNVYYQMKVTQFKNNFKNLSDEEKNFAKILDILILTKSYLHKYPHKENMYAGQALKNIVALDESIKDTYNQDLALAQAEEKILLQKDKNFRLTNFEDFTSFNNF